jgi:hypothetical protein
MSLVSNLQNFATRVATEIKGVRTLVNGNATDLSALTTTAKTNLVAAINEVKGSITAAGAQINDTAASTTTVYSSSKTNSAISTAVSGLVSSSPATLDTLKELADAIGDDPNYAATTATALGNRLRVDVSTQALTTTQQSNGQTNLGVYGTGTIGDPTTDFVATFVAGLS